MKKFLTVTGICLGIGILILTLAMPVVSWMQQEVGINVSGDSITWNKVKDASQGDSLTDGIVVMGSYVYDSAASDWNRTRGDASGNMFIKIIGDVLASTMVTDQKSVTTTPALIVASNTDRQEIILQNIYTVDAYCGNTGVTISDGFLLKAGTTFVDNVFSGAYYCVVGSATTTVSYREID